MNTLARRWASIRAIAVDLRHAVLDNELLGYAGNISFQIVYATPAVLLAGFAVLGYLRFENVWRDDLMPQLRAAVSPDTLNFINTTVESILGRRRLFWLTAGLLFALYKGSAATRATMAALNRIYGVTRERPTLKHYAISILLTIVTAACLVVALAVLQFGPLIAGHISSGGMTRTVLFIGGWGTAVVAMFAVVTIFIRLAPATVRPIRHSWLTGAAVVAGWALFAIAFRWYAVKIASSRTMFGNMASAVIALAFLFTSVEILLIGLQLDAILRKIERARLSPGREPSRERSLA